MIPVNGKLEKGMKEAADSLHVSEKTLRSWLAKGKFPPPPVVRQGTRVLKYFPDHYLREAENLLAS